MVLQTLLARCRRRLFVATADVKDLHVPQGGPGRRARSILDVLAEAASRGIDVRLLHSGVPSERALARLKKNPPGEGFVLRRCPRMHAKAVIADGRWMYAGSANLTGAGLGAKSPRRRNFESGVLTDETALIDPLADMLQAVWAGEHCADCGRRDHCPVPLEEPAL